MELASANKFKDLKISPTNKGNEKADLRVLLSPTSDVNTKFGNVENNSSRPKTTREDKKEKMFVESRDKKV